MAKERITKNNFKNRLRSLVGAGLLATTGLANVLAGGCASTSGIEKKVTPAYEIILPQSYPAEVNQLFSDIESVYGTPFLDELKEIPEMRDNNFTPEKLNALNTFYEIGEKIKGNEKAGSAIEDILKAGEGKNMISVPFREGYRMVENKKWDADKFIRELEDYVYFKKYRFSKDPIQNEYNNPGILYFVLKTDWKNFHDEDWKQFEKQGDEAVVLNKMNDPLLIWAYIEKNIYGKPDGPVDYAQSPEETKKRGAGDCEDLAILAAYYMEFLEKNNNKYKNAKVVSIGGYGKGHAFPSFEERGEKGFFVIDNTSYFKLRGIRRFNSIYQAIKEISKEEGINVTRRWRQSQENFLNNYRYRTISNF